MSATHHPHPTLLVARRFAQPLEAVLVFAGIVTLVMGSPTTAVWMLTVWLVAAMAYTVIAVRRLIHAAHDPAANAIAMDQLHTPIGVWSHRIHVDVIIIAVSSLVGVLGAITVLRYANASEMATFSRIISALSIVSAWTLLQFGYSRLYADSFFRSSPPDGLEFPGKPATPGLLEFAYFTFSVGATFQTSDTSVTNTHMRWLVTIQAVLCFFYNTVLLAFGVSLLLGR